MVLEFMGCVRVWCRVNNQWCAEHEVTSALKDYVNNDVDTSKRRCVHCREDENGVSFLLLLLTWTETFYCWCVSTIYCMGCGSRGELELIHSIDILYSLSFFR
ncbi:unnamed protein product [Choristocarpus tenellus]